MNIFVDHIDPEKYIIATYHMHSTVSLRDAAWNLAIGQSIGNPTQRNKWETEELFQKHSCVIEDNNLHYRLDLDKIDDGITGNDKGKGFPVGGKVRIGFPKINIDLVTDGISHLLVMLMGGQLDIDTITECILLDIQFPESCKQEFLGPKYGITGIRQFTGVYDKPLLGGILKPKTGMSPETMLEMVKELVEGGVNFIKEDEILSSPSFCRIEDRVPLIMDYLKGKNVIYAVSIHSDPAYLGQRVKLVHELGGNAVHVNFWCGLGAYKSIREMDYPIFLFFQKSGDRILTNDNHNFYIDWRVICKLAGMSGVDFIHAGMWGGYHSDREQYLKRILEVLHKHNVMPSLSCGMNASLIEPINEKFGIDYMANVGGAIHSHPGGTKAGAMAIRQAIDKDYGFEFQQAIDKYGTII